MTPDGLEAELFEKAINKLFFSINSRKKETWTLTMDCLGGQLGTYAGQAQKSAYTIHTSVSRVALSFYYTILRIYNLYFCFAPCILFLLYYITCPAAFLIIALFYLASRLWRSVMYVAARWHSALAYIIV